MLPASLALVVLEVCSPARAPLLPTYLGKGLVEQEQHMTTQQAPPEPSLVLERTDVAAEAAEAAGAEPATLAGTRSAKASTSGLPWDSGSCRSATASLWKVPPL